MSRPTARRILRAHRARRARLRAAELRSYLEDDYEPDEDFTPVERADLERRRREYVFGDGSRIGPARLGDLRGMPRVSESIERFITFFRDFRKFRERNARIQPGIFLEGLPGTGKTLTARIIATESGAKLINAGNFPREDWRYKADDISSLFSLAREYFAETKTPVIVYFDKLEAICHRERPSEAYDALLSEIDGIGGKCEGVFVIGASARPHSIDPEVLRAGRLGHRLRYFIPSESGRLDILKFYVEKKPREPIDLESLAQVMPDLTVPAEIEELVEGVYAEACFDLPEGEVKLKESDLIAKMVEEALGPPEGDWSSEEDRHRACVHEAGHVIAGVQLDRAPKLVVVPRSGYERGLTLDGMSDHPGQDDMKREIAGIFGGEIAEQMVLGERRFGSTSDVKKATELSIELVSRYGEKTNYWDLIDDSIMDNRCLTPLSDVERSNLYSQAREIRERCYQRAREALEEFGKEGIEHVARRISEREFLLGEDVERVVLEAVRGVMRFGL